MAQFLKLEDPIYVSLRQGIVHGFTDNVKVFDTILCHHFESGNFPIQVNNEVVICCEIFICNACICGSLLAFNRISLALY